MRTNEIYCIIKQLYPLNKYFNGVYSIDTLDSSPLCYPLFIISNTAPKHDSGKHWVAIYIKNQYYGEFFDSYGNKPNKMFLQFMKSRCRKVKHNVKQVQNILAKTCGNHCIYYLFRKSRGYSMKEIVKNLNDNIVKMFVVSCFLPNNDYYYSNIIYSGYNQKCRRMIENN